jgi:flagellar biosynthesis protein
MKDMQPHLYKLRQKAVAVKYNPEDIAPKIMAKGAGLVAERILENAKKTDVPVHKDAALVEELSKIDLGANIPPELYEVVAQILIFVSELDRRESLKNE